MFGEVSPLIALVLAILDYLFKSAINYRETEEGRAEWLDIVVAYEQITGDTLGEETARNERSQANSRGRQAAIEKRGNVSNDFRPLTED